MPPGASITRLDRPTTIRAACADVYLIRHGEDIEELRRVLEGERFLVREVSGPYGPEMAEWSANTRCLVNHCNAWQEIAAGSGPALVVEADFVPVIGFGSLAIPCDVERLADSLVYLYVCGPQLWDLDGGLRGHGGASVAYMVSPQVARRLLEFAESEIFATTPEEYMGWDASVGFWLNRRGVETYLPYRNLGEHGGLPNPEHRQAGLRSYHRADLLAGKLAFLPPYARSRRLTFRWLRLRARCWGIARLLAGRYLAVHDIRRSNERLRLLRIALGRHLFRMPPRDYAAAR